MSNLFSAEPEYEYQPEAEMQPQATTGVPMALPASAEVELALRKFWDVVRASADTIVTLRQEVASLKSQNAALAEQAPVTDIMKARVDELQAALATSEELNSLLEADVANAMRKVSELEAALEDGRNAQLQMRAEVGESLQHLEVELATSHHQRSLLEQELAGMSLRVAELEARIDEKNEQLLASTETTVRFEILQREKEELEQRLERLNQRLIDLEGLIDDKTQRIEVLSTDLSHARRDVVEFELQLSSRDAEVHELQEQCVRLRDRVAELEEERVAQAQRVEAAEPPAAMADEADAEGGEEWHELRDQLMAEAADLQVQLQRALAIVETYRAAGLRHLEDPNQRNQMTLFADAIEPQPAIEEPQLEPRAALEPGQLVMTEDEVLAIAQRLDELALRVEELLGIS